MKKSEPDRLRMPNMMVSALTVPSGGGSVGSNGGGGACGASDSEAMTDTSSVQSSDVDRASIRSVDERVEVRTVSVIAWSYPVFY